MEGKLGNRTGFAYLTLLDFVKSSLKWIVNADQLKELGPRQFSKSVAK